MSTRTSRRRNGHESTTSRRGSDALRAAGRAGFTARGVVYVLVGILAVRIALGDSAEQADRQGALRQIAEQPFGKVMLWALVVGLGGMALWRGACALWDRGPDRKATSRLLDGGRAVFYAAICWGAAAFAAGNGSSSSGDEQSKDWTASALKLAYGRWLVGLAGCVLIGVGVVLAVRALQRKFLKKLDTGAMSRRTEQTVTGLGVAGGVARGSVFAAAGVFILIAAVQFDPDEAKGVDDTLRSFTETPAGPWLLVAVAIGLVLFGVFSFASARWRRV